MTTNPEHDRRQAHAYLDLLPAEQLSAVRSLLETMLDPVSRSLANAPIEDEEISTEQELAVAESKEWLKHNKPVPHEEVLAEFGLTLDEFERNGPHAVAARPKRRGSLVCGPKNRLDRARRLLSHSLP